MFARAFPQFQLQQKLKLLTQPAKRLGQLYLNQLQKNPVRTNMVSTYVIYSLGDLLAQKVERELAPHHDVDEDGEKEHQVDDQVDVRRVLYVGGFVLCLWAPAMSLWLPRLDRWFNPANRGLGQIFKKVAFHQCTMPVFLNTSFMAWCTYWKSSADNITLAIKNKLESDVAGVTTRSIVIFTPINTGIFYFFPGPQRIVVMSFTNVFWNVYMSLVAHQDKPSTSPATSTAADSWSLLSSAAPVDLVERTLHLQI